MHTLLPSRHASLLLQASAADKKIKAFLKEQKQERIRRENEAKAEALGHHSPPRSSKSRGRSRGRSRSRSRTRSRTTSQSGDEANELTEEEEDAAMLAGMRRDAGKTREAADELVQQIKGDKRTQ